jgi:hypothetical protein
MIQEIGFALDSPLEGAGFELAVPPRTESLWGALRATVGVST